MQYHIISPAKTLNNFWQYFVIESRCVGFICLAKCQKLLLQQTENNFRNFQQYFEIEFLFSPKLNEKLHLSHVFLDIWLQKVFYLAVRIISDELLFFANPWKNQKYLFTNLFTPLLQMTLFLWNNIAFIKCTVEESISCSIFF